MTRSPFLQSEAFRTTRRKLLPDFWQATIVPSLVIAVPWARAADPASAAIAASTIPNVRVCTHPPFVGVRRVVAGSARRHQTSESDDASVSRMATRRCGHLGAKS
jgi:hypothetical protein